ncbi:hypothetical protein ACJRO7_022975 [Eucalyptus globulus]|uniref:Uncharacterized protein n=1 Tax=Eucalyptus globulus TaxID=34317 RepID=A0ABD3K5B0_EUCGL
MASRSPFLLLLLFLFLFALFSLLDPHSPAVKLPFHPEDVLPLLPRQLSWPILNALRRPLDLLPPSSARPLPPTALWRGKELASTRTPLGWSSTTRLAASSGEARFTSRSVSNAHSWTCMDIYIFATPYRVTWDYYFLSCEHTFEFKEWEGKAEFEYVKSRGVSIFLMEAGMIGTLQALWDVFPLFSNMGWGEKSNIGFLKKHMGASFEQRPQHWVTNISIDDIHSGDFLAISKIRGSGAYAGHTAVCLRDSEGKLWVGESGHDNDQGEDVIAVLPWDEWWEFELNKDDSNPHIALLPLHPDMRAKFNETAAWEYAESMNGKPYGYHNMLFSWIDTIDANYPPPLDAHVVASVMTVWNQMQPAYAANMWNEGLDLPDLLVETEIMGSSFAELLTIPEQDDWVYSDGKFASCVAVVLEMYKASGLFDPISSSIQVTEFTIKDAYSLKFFENNSSRLPKWCNDGDDLPGYNTTDLYPHMNERCPSLPPKYSRPSDC